MALLIVFAFVAGAATAVSPCVLPVLPVVPLQLLPELEAELRVIEPRDAGLGGIGHFGFFRASAEKSLWPIAANWIGTK